MTDTSSDALNHLPYLRRYARALVGSQTGGDQYLRVFLEAVLADPALLSSSEDLRLQMFSVFHDVCLSIGSSEAFAPEPEALVPAQSSLALLPELRRQVLLLVSLEDFSPSEAGRILHLTEHEVERHLEAARREIRTETPARVIIIEDEPLIAMDIARIVEEMGHLVCGTAADHAEAIRLANHARPDLVLADIQLKGGDSGIEAVQEILQNVTVPVVFVTGFPERLLTGERPEPAFLLTKPFKPKELIAIVDQALTLRVVPDL
jgi:CheY-like chemotaxis protein